MSVNIGDEDEKLSPQPVPSTPVNAAGVHYPSVVERYYNTRYKINVQANRMEDICVLVHSNKLCVITVAPSHPLISKKKKIKSIDFQITGKLNRLENKVTGKRKKGGQWLIEESPLCRVICEDGSRYTLYSCIKGKLVEVNEQLLQNPNLLIEKPQTNGYIAIIQPKLEQSKTQLTQVPLLEPTEYQETVKQREEEDSRGTEDTSGVTSGSRSGVTLGRRSPAPVE